MWHEIWIQNGRPREGLIARIRRKTRLQYHYAIRYVVKENTRIRNSKMAEAISENEDRILWDEVRKMTKSNNNLPNVMDGLDNVNEITDIFYNKYNDLYNCVSYDKEEMNALATDINSRIENECQYKINHSKPIITVAEVREAVHMLKQGKK